MAFGSLLPLKPNETGGVYDTIAGAMGSDHPMLTRAVLARRFLEEYVQVDDQDAFVTFLKQAKGEQYFEQFVTALLRREANEKWLGRESPASPLLTVDEHHALLMRIADEMWLNGVDALAKDTLLLTAEIVSQEELKKPTDIVRQVVDRIPQHPFLRPVGGSMSWRFDHEDFRSFYVGRLVGMALAGVHDNASALRSLLDVGQLPILSVRVAVAKTEALGIPSDWFQCLSAIAEAGSRASHLRENVGRLALMLLGVTPDDTQRVLRNVLVTGDAAYGRRLRNVRFVQCVFESVDFSTADLSGVVFERCEMAQLSLMRSSPGRYEVELVDTELPTKLVIKADQGREAREIFAPAEIATSLSQLGFRLPPPAQPAAVGPAVAEDSEMNLVFRAIRVFQRATAVNENVLKTRLGSMWSTFEADVLPELLRARVLIESDYRGHGHQRRFQMRTPFDVAEQARARCGGRFDRFIELLAG
jgi:hypothetical protein